MSFLSPLLADVDAILLFPAWVPESDEDRKRRGRGSDVGCTKSPNLLGRRRLGTE